MIWDTDFSVGNLPSDGEKCLFWSEIWSSTWGVRLGWFEGNRIFIEDYGYIDEEEMNEEVDGEIINMMPTHWLLIEEPE